MFAQYPVVDHHTGHFPLSANYSSTHEPVHLAKTCMDAACNLLTFTV